MAAGEDKGGDPIERAMRRKAEADAAAKKASAPAEIPFSAPKRETPKQSGGTVRSGSFYEPLRADTDEPGGYTPPDVSFFAPSAEERAEQARRAAQRVRRRVKGDEDDADATAPAQNSDPKPRPVPVSARAKDTKAVPRPIAAQPAPVEKAVPKAPRVEPSPPAEVAAPPERPSKPSASLMDRAFDRATNRTSPTVEVPAPKPPRPAPKEPSVDAIARSIEAAARPVASKSAKPAAPKPSLALPPEPKIAMPTGASAAAPLIERAARPAAVKPETSVKGTQQKPTPDLIARSQATAAPAKANLAEKARSTKKTAPRFSASRTSAAAEIDSVYAAEVDAVQSQKVITPSVGIQTVRTKAFAAFEWMIAGRYLRARKKEGFVSVITGFSLVGIALGVATLIVVMAVMTGFRETLITQIVGGSPHINVRAQIGPFENFDAVADQVRSVDGVEYVTPVVQGQVLATGNQRHSGVVVRGLRKADLERLIETAEPEVINGSLSDFVDDQGVALGADLAAKLGLRVGDFITLISPDGDITPFQATPMPRVKDYKIIQTFRIGVQEIDYNVAFMPFSEAQIYFNKQNQADTLDVFVDDPQRVSDSLRNIEPGSYEDEIFRASRSSITINNWKNLNGRLIGAINLERQVMFVILTMIILVAALNIISGLVMLVKDKARDVAIMRTMGMARGSVLRIFFICGSSIGVTGSILGVVLGLLFVWNIHAVQGFVEWVTGTQVWDPSVRAGIQEIPTNLQFSDVALTLFIALGLSFIATLFPAWKAAKLDPVEALRYE